MCTLSITFRWTKQLRTLIQCSGAKCYMIAFYRLGCQFSKGVTVSCFKVNVAINIYGIFAFIQIIYVEGGIVYPLCMHTQHYLIEHYLTTEYTSSVHNQDREYFLSKKKNKKWKKIDNIFRQLNMGGAYL